ncbi:stretch-activated Ca2+-permeable channel component-domain-containing protein [Tirmania nivea]|nr:stretch-activated Ca2+-permeable channel component-domain-containing protein [Tirmania nivea]
MARVGGGELYIAESHERRAAESVMIALKNGVARNLNIQYGELQHWYLSEAELFGTTNSKGGANDELRKREDGDGDIAADGAGEVLIGRASNAMKVYITFNTCLQPEFNMSLPLEAPLPQLQLYISNNTSNEAPGPKVKSKPQVALPVVQGFGSMVVEATGQIFVGVYAANLSESEQAKYQRVWNYEIAISTKAPYHSFESKKNLYLIDSDDNAALLITGNMTRRNTPSQEEVEKIMKADAPYRLYAQNTQYTSPFRGLERSYCAISKLAQLNVANVETSLTTRGLGHLPKQQFHLTGLNSSSTYLAYLAKPPTNVTSGVIWDPLTITTKTDGNCQIIYDLPFCSEVAYSVPSNPTIFTTPQQLGSFYDNIAQGWYQNFSYSLQQIPCNSTDLTLQYSFARDCDDCASAYKTWLCAVSIPRCADFTSNLPYLAERGLNTEFFNKTLNQTIPNDHEKLAFYSRGNETYNAASLRSRNPLIESELRPGPYKEIKPCMDLCWSLVQSCPSDFGFTCPRLGSWGAQVSYGQRSEDGDVSCSWLGAVYFLSRGLRVQIVGRFVWVVVGVLGWLVL